MNTNVFARWATNSNKQTKRQSERNAELTPRETERFQTNERRRSIRLLARRSLLPEHLAASRPARRLQPTARSFAVGATAVATGTPPRDMSRVVGPGEDNAAANAPPVVFHSLEKSAVLAPPSPALRRARRRAPRRRAAYALASPSNRRSTPHYVRTKNPAAAAASKRATTRPCFSERARRGAYRAGSTSSVCDPAVRRGRRSSAPRPPPLRTRTRRPRRASARRRRGNAPRAGGTPRSRRYGRKSPTACPSRARRRRASLRSAMYE